MKSTIWYFCSGCGASCACPLCGASSCGQSFTEDCPGCVKARKDFTSGNIPRQFDWKPGRRPVKPLRGTLARVDRHRRLFKRKHPPAKLSDLLADWT